MAKNNALKKIESNVLDEKWQNWSRYQYLGTSNKKSKAQNSYFDYYYSGQDIYAYVKNAPDKTLPLEGIAFNIEQKKTPVYGAFSNTYNAVMRGTRIITGSMVLTTTTQDFMIELLSDVADGLSGKGGWYYNNPLSDNSISEGSGQSKDKENINRYWTINSAGEIDDAGLLTSGKHIFSSHPPFDLIIAYGIQSVSITDDWKLGTSDLPKYLDKFDNASSDNALYADVNERLIENSDSGDNRIIIKGIELTSCQMSMSPDGSPLNEVYTFFARDYAVERV